uniref:Uncharacterized protein n=1 Tax=Compsopogon caeruleus TaxID=31354 RepID=A0A7S1TFR8_9RHOD
MQKWILSAPAGYATYHRRCQYHGIRPDPSVAICLYALHPVVKVSRLAQDLDLIPIVETLKTPAVAQFAREIDLSGLNLGSISALLVAEMVQSCSFLRVLLLGRNALRDEGASMIIAALKGNRELSKIDLRSNRISSAGALKIARLLQEKDVGRALNEVVFVNNHMMQQGVDAISEVCESRKIAVYLDGNLVMAEVLNSLTHGTGLVAAIIAGASMIEEADSRALPLQLYRSIVIFCVSLCCMFASSCFYHSFFRGAKGAKEILKVMDHCSIFLLIAGTYTPILLKFIWSPEHPHSLVGPTLFYLVWGLALVGITMSARLFGKYTPSRKVRAGLALIMGWLIIFSIRLLWQRMPPRCLLLLSLGGVAYTTGVPFYVKGQEVSMYHVVWHISVMIGAALHYLTVLNYVVRPGLEY